MARRTELALAAWLALVNFAAAQRPTPPTPPAPPQPPAAPKADSDDVVAQALKNNPDILAAEAKLREAAALLQRSQLDTVQRVMTIRRRIEELRTTAEAVEQAAKAGAVSATERAQGRAQMAEIDALRAQLEGLAGKTPVIKDRTIIWKDWRETPAFGVGDRVYSYFLHPTGVAGASPLRQNVNVRLLTSEPSGALSGPLVDKLRATLDKAITLEESVRPALTDTVEELRTLAKLEVPVRVAKGLERERVAMGGGSMPLGAALLMLEDSLDNARVVVREYGLLVTQADRVPPGAVGLREFWKGAKPQSEMRDLIAPVPPAPPLTLPPARPTR